MRTVVSSAEDNVADCEVDDVLPFIFVVGGAKWSEWIAAKLFKCSDAVHLSTVKCLATRRSSNTQCEALFVLSEHNEHLGQLPDHISQLIFI